MGDMGLAAEDLGKTGGPTLPACGVGIFKGGGPGFELVSGRVLAPSTIGLVTCPLPISCLPVVP